MVSVCSVTGKPLTSTSKCSKFWISAAVACCAEGCSLCSARLANSELVPESGPFAPCVASADRVSAGDMADLRRREFI